MQLDGKTITVAMIVGPKESKKPKAHQEGIMRKMTHLQMDQKKIEIISGLELCKSLTTVYL